MYLHITASCILGDAAHHKSIYLLNAHLGKLPSPRTVNELFAEYTGPVLMAQGALDPLNDAPARAYAYQTVRSNVEVDLLPLGHCPMDEDGEAVARSIQSWFKKLR